ncbi:MAG: hypothetical protein JNJ47_03525 [Alphaproteobacteria bacterium]|nr:hypothetical protein [Alphaproteobacteria bacterium]
MFDIYIKNKFLKTPEGNPFEVPTLALVRAIEEEWEKDPSPHYGQKPLTSLAATTLDRIGEARESYITYIVQSVPRDVILFWSPEPAALVKLQEAEWQPLIQKINQALGLHLVSTSLLSLPALNPLEEEKVRTFLYHLTTFQLSGFVHLLTLTSSFAISYLLFKNELKPEIAWDLAHLHEHEQQRVWGKDAEALAHEKAAKEEFLETLRYLALVRE